MSSESSKQFSITIPPVPQGIDAVASLAGGFWIVALAATHRMRARVPILAIGGWLLGRGAMGVLREIRRMEEAARPLGTSHPEGVIHPDPSLPVPEDPLDEANWESFPASDPPSITRPKNRGTANGVH